MDDKAGVITWSMGPRMRFERAPRDAITRMVVRVRSLQRATEFLASRHMLERRGTDVCIALTAVEGLPICLIE